MKNRFLLSVMIGTVCLSCIQAEKPNTEADIETCVIVDKDGKPEENIKGEVLITNNRIIAQATPLIDLTALGLNVTLTPGATIEPDPAVIRDYSNLQKYTVTSEDGQWKKEYTVSVDTFDLPVKYSFESVELSANGKYYDFYEEVLLSEIIFKQYIWASGNGGFSLTGQGKGPDTYPTSVAPGYLKGKGARLETKSTGHYGKMVRMPIAAGNLFIGKFEVGNAMIDAMRATRFGIPFGKKPKTLKGYYKYKRGAQLTDVGKEGDAVPVAGFDKCDIYAVLYKSEGLEQGTLDGANVLTSPNIIAIARLKNPKVYEPGTNLDNVEYIPFEVPFEYEGQKVAFEWERARNYEYNLAVVFTSSIDGATFKGAVGSVLYVDEVEVICE